MAFRTEGWRGERSNVTSRRSVGASIHIHWQIPFHMEFLLCVKHSSLLPEHGLQSSRGEHDRLSLGRLGNHLKAPRDAKLNPKTCEVQRLTTLVDEPSQTHRISLVAEFHTF